MCAYRVHKVDNQQKTCKKQALSACFFYTERNRYEKPTYNNIKPKNTSKKMLHTRCPKL